MSDIELDGPHPGLKEVRRLSHVNEEEHSKEKDSRGMQLGAKDRTYRVATSFSVIRNGAMHGLDRRNFLN